MSDDPKPMTEEETEELRKAIQDGIDAETSIEFWLDNEKGDQAIIELRNDGEIYIRGERVASNQGVYEAMREWLIEGSTFKAGVEAARKEAEMIAKAGQDRADGLEALCNRVAKVLADEVYTTYEGYVSLEVVAGQAVEQIKKLKRRLADEAEAAQKL